MALSSAGRAVGLEIDTGVVRAVEATGSAGAPKLVNLAQVSLPVDAVVDGMIVKPLDVGRALKNLWSSGEIKYKRVLLGLANQGVLVRYAAIPKVPLEKLSSVIRFQAQEHLPLPIENVVLDHLVIGETTIEGSSMLEVLLVAARRDMLHIFMEALDSAGLEPADIDVSTLALLRTLPADALKRSVAMVNIANGLSSLLIAVNGKPRLARLNTVKIKDLAIGLGLSLQDVMNKDSISGTNQKIYTDWIENLAGEIRSSLNYYQGQLNAAGVEAVFLNGRGAGLGNIAVKLENALGITVRVINPFSNYVNAKRIEKNIGIQAVEYAICAGLASRGLEG